MTFEEAFAIADKITGWLSKDEAKLLWKAANATRGIILEVGCFHGRSTSILSAFGRQVYAVDQFSGFDTLDMSGAKAKADFLANARPNVVLFHERIESWKPRPVGFAYLDGDHSYNGTKAQIRKALSCRPQAIAIHDVNDTGEGREIKKAAISLLGPWQTRIERLAVWVR